MGVSWAAGWPAVWATIRHPHLAWILLAPAGMVMSQVGYTLAYREAVLHQEGPDLDPGDAASVVATGFAPLNLRGGFALDAYALRREGLNHSKAALTVRTIGLIEYAVLAPATLGASAFLMVARWHAQAGLLPSWVIGVPVGAVVSITALVFFRRSDGRRPKAELLRRGLKGLDGTLTLLGRWPAGMLIGLGMAVYLAGDIGALFGCVALFSPHQPSVPAVIVGFATGYALTRRSLPLAGAGVVEALLPFALNWVGIPLARAVAAVVVYRSFNLWLATIPGLVGLRSVRRPKRR